MGKVVAYAGLSIFFLFVTALVWVAMYVGDQTQRCATIGAQYGGPGICKISEEKTVRTP